MKRAWFKKKKKNVELQSSHAHPSEKIFRSAKTNERKIYHVGSECFERLQFPLLNILLKEKHKTLG